MKNEPELVAPQTWTQFLSLSDVNGVDDGKLRIILLVGGGFIRFNSVGLLNSQLSAQELQRQRQPC